MNKIEKIKIQSQRKLWEGEKNGKPCSIWLINQQYKHFSFGVKEPFRVGVERLFKTKVQEGRNGFETWITPLSQYELILGKLNSIEKVLAGLNSKVDVITSILTKDAIQEEIQQSQEGKGGGEPDDIPVSEPKPPRSTTPDDSRSEEWDY